MESRPSSRIDVSKSGPNCRVFVSDTCVLGSIGLFVLLALLTACGGSSSPPPPPHQNPLSAVPNSLTFNATTAQSFVVSGGSGTVTPSNNCSNIATLSGPQSGAVGTWSVTPAGTTASCMATFTDTSNAAATVAINVQLGLAATPNTLNFTTTTAQNFSVTGGNGTITESDSCAGIANLTPPSSGKDGTWTVTPSRNGTCAVTFTDSSKSTAQVAITVNLSSGASLSVNPTSLTFTSTTSQTFSVIGGSGPITELDDCSGVATVQGPASGIDGTWIVTPTNSTGSCTATFTDSSKATAQVAITVNLSSGASLSVNPTSLTFTSTTSQTFSVIGGSAPITELDDCSGVATVKGPSSGIDGTWIVTPANSTGFCTATFTDSTNAQATEMITDNISNPTSTLTWQIQLDSSCSTAAYLKFFDETANLQWPGSNLFYVLNQPGQIQTFALACTTGDKICYGASLYQNSDQYYWGVGVLNDQSCTSCCSTCSNATVTPVNLTGTGCSAARSEKTGRQRGSGKTTWEKNMDHR